MDKDVLDRVTRMVARFAGCPTDKLNGETVLEADLGITGDDASEFLEAYSRDFEVDLSGFEFYRHFDAEGWNPFAGFLTRLRRGEKLRHVPVTIALLARAAEERQWPGFAAPAT